MFGPDPYWNSRENSFIELIELFSTNNVSLVKISSCSNTGSIRDDQWRSQHHVSGHANER